MTLIINHKQLDIWKDSILFVKEIYKIIKKLPKAEGYILGDQMARASVSIASNIAEGAQRGGTIEFIRFLFIAKASAAEVETQIIICFELNYISEEEYKFLIDKIDHLQKMIYAFIKHLKTSQLRTH